MARQISGTGRVTVFPLLHVWPDVYGVVAYAPAGHFGDTAVMGYIPIAEVPDVSLLDVAARHLTRGADREDHAIWAVCTGWSARVVQKPGTMELHDVGWSLEIDATVTLKAPMYGHGTLHVGRFALDDEDLMRQARELLPGRVLV
ncbi:hypothetical protein ACIQMR_35530 [Streptomyces sp. NPDC091376]|uniref:hypothetical protein n=1 Tax=Streptomyces sp. NPDC091376 TaxID=3365994 RepID=UPI0037F4F814